MKRTRIALTLLALLSLCLIAAADPPGEPISPVWVYITVGILAVAGAGAFGVRVYRKVTEQNRQKAELWDVVQLTLDRLFDLAQDAVRELPEAEVRAAALEVYTAVIAPTFLARLVAADAFVGMVVEQWERLTRVGESVEVGVVRARLASAPAPDPPRPVTPIARIE